MMREKYESLPATTLRELAKARGLKGISTLKKDQLVERMLEEDQKEADQRAQAAVSVQADTQTSNKEETRENIREDVKRDVPRRDEYRRDDFKRDDNKRDDVKKDDSRREDSRRTDYKRDETSRPRIEPEDSGEIANGILEVMGDGYGFIRSENFLPGENDIYVAPSQIRRFNLKTGDIVKGNIRVKSQNEKFGALLYVGSVNGLAPDVNAKRPNFEDMTPIFPNERIRLERPNGTTAMRIMDLISPIGKGQRGMIVSPPKAGKTTLLKDVAKSVLSANPKAHLIILLIDERPEEVTDMKEAILGENVEIIYSTFDELPEHHKRVSEMVIERAKRLVENHEDVIILLDSITRLARAYNLTVPPSGRTLSGGTVRLYALASLVILSRRIITSS